LAGASWRPADLPYELRRNAAKAQSRALEARIDDTLNEVASQVSRADAAHTGIANAQAQLALASSTLARLEPLLGKGFVTAQQIDQARTARDSARITLDQAVQQALAARQAVSSVRPLQEQLAASQADEALAERDFAKTVVIAPFDGKVIGLNIAVGELPSTMRRGLSWQPPIRKRSLRWRPISMGWAL
jgi:multidrug efflux system membrane fusion protein